jgi:signal transduction histidine kinase
MTVTVHRPEDSSKEYSIVLTVADNDQGIPAGNLNRVSGPFFSL